MALSKSDKLWIRAQIIKHYPETAARCYGIPLRVKEGSKDHIQSVRKTNLEKFFSKKGRRCPKCRTKVVVSNSAGGKYKKYHVDCAPRKEEESV